MDAHSLAWIDSWTEWQTPSPSFTSSSLSSSSSYTTNTPLLASDHSSSPSSAPPTLTLDPYSPVDLSYLSPPLSLSYSPSGSDSSNLPSPLDIPRHFPSPLDLYTSDYSTSPSDSPLDTGAPAHLLAPVHDTVPALGFNDFTSEFPALCTSQSPGTHLPISSPSWPSRFPSVAEGSYTLPVCDNMLGLDWSYYSSLPPNHAIPDLMVHPQAQYLTGTSMDEVAPPTSPVSSNGCHMVDVVYTPPDALACPPPRTQRITRARKSSSSTTRSIRRTPSKANTPRPSPNTSSSSSSSSSSIKTYKPRSALGTGTPNFTSTTPCGTSYLCTTCHSTYPLTRSSDFTRHVLTHYPEYRGGALLCCGVPVDSDQCLAMMAKGMIPPDAPVRRYYGRWMVGGCGLLCARTDVLRKHLGNGRKGCVGDLTGDWHPPKLPKTHTE